MIPQPTLRPRNPRFGSGPVRKFPHTSFESQDDILGVSHRSARGLALLQRVLTQLRDVLDIPPSYELAFISGGGTGAMEFILWNLLGIVPVDLFSNGVFGDHWLWDLQHELKVPSLRSFVFDHGKVVDFSAVLPDHDTVFVWTETPSGTSVDAHAPWLATPRTGLTLCDAVSAVFCTPLPWENLDAVAFSWQKGLGGEAGLGTVVLSPKAQERLQTHTPPWPRPRLFRPLLVEYDGQRGVSPTFWQGYTINTVSLAVVEDMSRALSWATSQGGLAGLLEKVRTHDDLVTRWVSQTEGFSFLVGQSAARAKQVACIVVEDPKTHQRADWTFLQKMARLLEEQGVAWDILNHRQSVPCLRLWLGPTVETEDVEALLPWLSWARERVSLGG